MNSENRKIEIAINLLSKGYLIEPVWPLIAPGICGCEAKQSCMFPTLSQGHSMILEAQSMEASPSEIVNRQFAENPFADVGLKIICGEDIVSIEVLKNKYNTINNKFKESLQSTFPVIDKSGNFCFLFRKNARCIVDQEAVGAIDGVRVYSTYHYIRLSESIDLDSIPPVAELPCLPEIILDLLMVDSNQEEDHISFPVDSFPPAVSQFVEKQASSIGCPSDFVGASILGVAAAAIGDKTVLEIKEGYREKPILYLAIVADPGSGKTPALKSAMKPIFDYQQRLVDKKMKELVSDSNKKIDNHKVRDSRKRKSMLYRPESFSFNQIYMTDATPEAVAEILSSNSNGIMGYFDEMSDWFKCSKNRFWLECWAGNPVMVNRKNDLTLFVANPIFNVLGAMTPDVCRDIVLSRKQDDGFLDRILWSYPPSLPKVWSQASVEESTMDGYHRTISFLLDWPLVDGPVVLKLSEDSRKRYDSWTRDHFNEVQSHRFPGKLKGSWAKIPALLGRITLILHCLWSATEGKVDETVEVDMIDRAIMLIEYFKRQAKKVRLVALTEESEQRISKFVSWMIKKDRRASKREVQRANLLGVKSAEDVEDLFVEMKAAGVGTYGYHGRSIQFILAEKYYIIE